MERTIKQGLYRHYEGETYEVLGVATCPFSKEWFVVCRKDAGDMETYPLNTFCDFVIHENTQVQRFTLISEADIEEAIA